MPWLVMGLSAGCGGATSESRAVQVQTQASVQIVRSAVDVEGSCDAVVVIEGGAAHGTVCAADARAHGLAIVDLTDRWTPGIFAAVDGQVPSFHDRYLALAREAAGDELAELYGVVPALAIVRARLADEARHTCRAGIDPRPILALDHPYSQDDKDAVRANELARLAIEARRDPEASPRYAGLEREHAGLLAAQAILRCEGWLIDKDVDGSFTWRTGNAVFQFQRRNFLMPTERLDQDTRVAMQIDARELDFLLALRVLRERVVDATGILEDGTAGAGPQPILGRMLDPPAMRAGRGAAPLPDAAPDLVGAMTEAAARQLGWTDAAGARAFLDRYPEGVRVALALPALPSYHAPHMELGVEIDRGDIYYDDQPPAYRRVVAHSPALVVFSDDHGTRRPLVRWPTTIGGWADVRLPGGVLVQRWKESEVGPRIWRDLYAGPTWIPPPTTPDRDLVKNLWNGHWGLKTEVLGPGPHAAYGMILLEHLQVMKQRDGSERLDDNGIGTHGSASVTSIVDGTSHGCHRLYNQLAVRLGDFLLRHRTHVVRGEQPVAWRRTVFHNDELFRAAIDTRGFLYELTPPVPVEVTKGQILSKRKLPPLLAAPARP
jgi:hypothetical protein